LSNRVNYLLFCFAVVSLLTAARPSHGDWSCYRHDNARSGVTDEELATPLYPQWVYAARHAPRPAWPEPCKEMNRMAFDYAYHVSAANGLLFFGSSADHKVYAIDIETGKERWSFFTEAPVRFAPAVSGERVFVASDDGCLYCLSVREGKLLWKFRAAPRDEMLIGNEQMISRWALRSGVVVDGDVVYVTAGMWTPDGVYVYALRARDGSVIWKNDTCGRMYMALPHSSMEGVAGVAPQGYLLLMRDTLIVPNGRCSPAGFDCRTGDLLYLRNDWTKLHHAGDSWVIGGNGLIWSTRRPAQPDRHVVLEESGPAPGEGMMAWDCRTGEERLAMVGRYRAAIRDDIMYASGRDCIAAIDLKAFAEAAREFIGTGKIDPNIPEQDMTKVQTRRAEGSLYPWHISKVTPMDTRRFEKWRTKVGWIYTIILAGDKVIAGGKGSVVVLSAEDGKVLWRATVDGKARGLAVADGRLIVSTTTGKIICFAAQERAKPITVAPAGTKPEISGGIERKVVGLLDAANIKAGYCLVLGAGNGQLLSELARRSELVVYCRESDEEKVAATRKMLDNAGLYGVRVAVHQGTLDRLPYARYFANLIVCDEEAVGDVSELSAREMYRVLRPCGGVAVFISARRKPDEIRSWLAKDGVPAGEIRIEGKMVLVERGALPNAAVWTHEYASAARSGATTDPYVRLPLRVLWFGRPGPARMVSRHWRTPAPLFMNGLMFIAGEHHVMCVDAYNGRELWCRELPDVGRYPAKYRGGNIVCDERHVYALQGTKCLQLDSRTGKAVRVYEPPEELTKLPVRANPITRVKGGFARGQPVPNTVQWEYLAVTEKFVVGSVGLPNISLTWWTEAYPESKYVFALRKEDGKPAWIYEADESVSPNAIVIKGNRLYLIDRTSLAQIERLKRRGIEPRDRATLKALDLETGKVLWETSKGLIARMLWSGDDVLLVTGWGQPSAYSPADGRLLWEKKRVRGMYYPIIVGDVFYEYPFAYDLHTGERIERPHPLTGDVVPWALGMKGGCGSLSGCPAALFYRSGATGIYDIEKDSGLHWLGQVRPSCWVNMIPAGGLLLMPEGASSCTCPYNFQTSLAMVHAERQEEWAVFPERAVPIGSRIKRLFVNFGAVGDKRDEDGRLWLAFPRPFRPGALMLPLTVSVEPRYYRYNADELSVKGTKRAWIYASGCEGALRMKLDLVLNRPAVALPCKEPPRIDGRLDDSCWDGRAPLILTDDKQAVDSRVVAYLRSDDDNLYIGFERKASMRNGKPVPWTRNTNGRDAPVWRDDSFNIRIANAAPTVCGIYLAVSASGATFDGLARRKPQMLGTSKQWSGDWTSAVHVEQEVWTAEVAIPWEMLKRVDIPRDRLLIFVESINRTGVGAERVQFKYRGWRKGVRCEVARKDRHQRVGCREGSGRAECRSRQGSGRYNGTRFPHAGARPANQTDADFIRLRNRGGRRERGINLLMRRGC